MILFACLCLASGLNADCVSLERGSDSQDVSGFAEVLVDSGGGRGIESIARDFAARAPKVYLAPGGENLRGAADAAYWLRICVRSSSDTVTHASDRLLLEFPDHRVDEIAFFVFGGRGTQHRFIQTGSEFDFATRDVGFRSFVFDLGPAPVEFGGRHIIYLRLRDAGSLHGGLRLYSSAGFRNHVARENLLSGLYTGMMAVLLICSLWFWLRGRNPAYPPAIGLLIALALYVLAESGAAIDLFRGGWPRWNEYLAWVAAIGGFIAFVAFARECIETRGRLPGIDAWLRGLALASFIVGSLCIAHLRTSGTVLAIGAMCLVSIAGLIVVTVFAALAWKLSRRRHSSDLLFVFALVLQILASVPHVLARTGIAFDPFATRYVFQLGSVAAMLLFFAGPGDSLRDSLLERKAFQESARLKNSFLTSMSHELRTPLNAMLGMSDLLYTAPLNHEHRGYLEVIRKSGDSMLRMVDSLLDMLSIEAGTLVLENLPFDLHRLINSASLTASEVCAQKGLGFQIHYQNSLSRGYRGDPARIKQVIENVLDNAVKFTDRGSVVLDASARRSGSGREFDEIVIRIADTGIGIAADRREDIFQSFTRVDESEARRTGGLGVGLSMVRNLVHLMDGHVRVSSQAGRGTAFELYIPLQKAPELFAYERRDAALRGDERDTDAQAGDDGLNGGRPLRILLVEDNRDNRLLFHAFMRATKYEVDVATNGRRAVEKFKEEEYDVVFMDIQMPELDGISATRQIRGWEQHAFESGARENRVPIYALTAHSLAEEIQRSIEAGCDGHIAKPVRKQEILQVLHHL